MGFILETFFLPTRYRHIIVVQYGLGTEVNSISSAKVVGWPLV